MSRAKFKKKGEFNVSGQGVAGELVTGKGKKKKKRLKNKEAREHAWWWRLRDAEV